MWNVGTRQTQAQEHTPKHGSSFRVRVKVRHSLSYCPERTELLVLGLLPTESFAASCTRHCHVTKRSPRLGDALLILMQTPLSLGHGDMEHHYTVSYFLVYVRSTKVSPLTLKKYLGKFIDLENCNCGRQRSSRIVTSFTCSIEALD